MKKFYIPASQNSKPENGDVICVNRGLYLHYGVYVSENNHVIHYTGETGPNDFNGVVRETSLNEFLNGAENFNICKFPERPILNNIFCSNKSHGIFKLIRAFQIFNLINYKLYSGAETVARAKSRLGENKYNLALNNCEHFAIWCKTGVRDSSQVDNILNLISNIFK